MKLSFTISLILSFFFSSVSFAESPSETAVRAIPSVSESLRSIGELRTCLSRETENNPASSFCSLGENKGRDGRNRSLQNLCNNHRAQKNTQSITETSEKINREILANVTNPKHDFEEAIRFLNSSPDGFNAFTLPKTPPQKPEYGLGLLSEFAVSKILDHASEASFGSDFLSKCKEKAFVISMELINTSCMQQATATASSSGPGRIDYTRYSEIEESCGLPPVTDPLTRSHECWSSNDLDLISQREFDRCMRSPSIGSYTFTNGDYIHCRISPRERSPEDIESCKRNIDRAREQERVRLQAQKQKRCEKRKTVIRRKCQREFQQRDQREEEARAEHTACIARKREEIKTRVTKRWEEAQESKRQRQQNEERTCKRKSLNDLFCGASEIAPIPECANKSSEEDSEYDKCSRAVLITLFNRNKENFAFGDGETVSERIDTCQEKQGFSEGNCKAFAKQIEESDQAISELYTPERMQKAQTQFDQTKQRFQDMLESWKDSGKISQEKLNTLNERLQKTTLTPPETRNELAKSYFGKARCICHRQDNHEGETKECRKNTITLGPDLMIALDQENGQKSLTMTLAHEIGHALAPDMTETENIFNNAYQCLSKEVSSDQQIHHDPKTKRRFAKETVADWLSSEFLAHQASNNPPSIPDIEFSIETTFCGYFEASSKQSDPCMYKDGRFLYPKEMSEKCLGNNKASTYPNFPDRLSVFTENPNLRDAIGCRFSERRRRSSRRNGCEI